MINQLRPNQAPTQERPYFPRHSFDVNEDVFADHPHDEMSGAFNLSVLATRGLGQNRGLSFQETMLPDLQQLSSMVDGIKVDEY